MEHYADQDIVMGVLGGVAVVLSVVMFVAYRNYKYEQELDSLLWKIDSKDLKVSRKILLSLAFRAVRSFSLWL